MSHANAENVNMSGATLKAYSIGFVLSIILTAIPFGLVYYGGLSHNLTITALVVAAGVQIVVHLYYFLHLDASEHARSNLHALFMAVLIMALIIVGTLWIMYHLHYRLVQ